MTSQSPVEAPASTTGNVRLTEGQRKFWTPVRERTLRIMFANGCTDAEIGKAVGNTDAAVEGFRIRAGLRRTVGKPAPADFASLAPSMYIKNAVEHWGVSERQVHRWHAECGTSPRPRYERKVKPAPAPKQAKSAGSSMFAIPAVPPVPARMADQAAHHLRRFYPRVCRARTLDPRQPDGIWLVGTERLNEDRLIQRAEKNGFDPMGWR